MTAAVSQYDPYAEALARAPRPMTEAFLRSPLYDTLMQRYVQRRGPTVGSKRSQGSRCLMCQAGQ